MEQNQLTRDLYAAGYTRENHPSFVYWSDWQNFGYLFEALLKFTWETPCGLLVDGKSDLGRGLACSDASFQGIDYCPENDNPLLRCPYERKDCPHSISGFPVPLCPCHTTGKRYSFEQSVEKVEMERSERQHRQYMEITGGVYCACVVGCNGYEGGRVEVKYDVEQCIRCRCQNPVCVIRKQKRDLSRANIFYDVRRTWITRIGFLEEKKVQVTKGERVFPHPVARTDAEIWLEMKKAHFNPLWSSSVIDSPHLTPEDRRQTFFSKMHRRYGEYDYFEFHYDVENIRIAKSEQRDLLQDLRDVADGLEVIHAVDLKKEQAGVTDEDIFNRYTGDGGLHGLRRSDYENYNAFSAAKKELENGQFFTPPPLCEMIVSALRLSDTDLVADLTCGMGNFFNFLPNERNAYGCEVDPNACAVARKLYPQAHIVQGDIRDYEPQTHFDVVLGNPPFHLRWIMPDATVMTSHQYYCLKAAKLLKPLGILAVIVPASFLADSFSDKGAIRMMESHFSFLGQVMLPEHAFSDSGVDGFPTKLQFWQKKSAAADWTPKRYSTDCADIHIPSGHPVVAASALYEKFVMVAKAELAGNRNKVFLELAQLKTTKSTFLYQVKKYLYQIRSHPATREKYDACFSYVHRFYTQRQPVDMPYEEWQRVQLTEAKVLTYLKQALCRQNAKPEQDEIRLVKQKYSFVYKAYSRKMAKLLTDEMRTPVPIYQAVLDDKPERFPGYERLLRRKRREYDNQEQPFSEMTENAQLADWIGRFQYWDAQNHSYIHLNPLQSHDVNLTLQKRYAFLQWEQGSGKTPAAIFTGKHRVEMGAVHSIWVISSAISIRNNWDVILKGAGFSYVFVERLADLQRIRPGDFVILTLNKVSQYKKQIGRYIKQLGYKIQFIFDESDNISNPSSKQALSVLSCFRRCKYKLLTTGTSTRNNISEFAPQLELLYNNSINMISWCRTLYSYDKRSADMEHKENPYYAMPIPAYKKGYRLFANSHLPEKITVFGVGQRNQDIYNADELDRLLGKTVITRTFEEVTGKDIRRIHQMPIPFLPEEREVYNIVLKEFYRIQREYYSSTGNSRKDALMRLIQQITLLLRISAAPDCMKEYEGETPLKEVAVVEALARWPDEIVAIGVRHTTVLDRYAAAIREYLPDRPLFVVTGSTVTFAKRRALRDVLRDSRNGILLCTQQSLPSSVNFEFVNKIIIPEMHYNNAGMSQFYMRFVRYTSTEKKDLYFPIYIGSLESNLMQMVLAKEKLTMFMKGQDADMDEIYAKFGVDYDLLSTLMTRETDDEGHLRIHWGEQKIA